MTAPAPTPAGQQTIDRFGIFDEQREAAIVESVARAIQARLAYHRVVVRDSEATEAAAAAVTAYRATQDGGAEEAVTITSHPEAAVSMILGARRRLLGDAIVDDASSPVASAARSAFRLGWDAALEALQ